MSDDLEKILYGETEKVTLLDGKEYTIRELNLNDISLLNLGADLNDPNNIINLAHSLLRSDNPELEREDVGKLISVRMMKDGSDLMKKINKIMGVGDKKND